MEFPPELLGSAAKLTGWLLVHSLWQGAVIAAGLAIILMACRNGSAALRHALCFVALSAMPLAMICTALALRNDDQPSQPSPQLAFASIPTAPMPASEQAADAPLQSAAAATSPKSETTPAPAAAPALLSLQRMEPLLPWFSGAWACGVVLLSIRHLGGWQKVRRLRQTGAPASARLQQTFERLARAFGVASAVRLLQSAEAATPMLTGVLKPIVLLPGRIVTGLPPEELEAVLAHELAHLARGDAWSNLALVAIETLFFYHPAVWWIAHRTRCEREHAADDLALSVCKDRRAYAGALAHLAELQLPADTALAASGGNLLARIRRIVQPPPRERVVSGWSVSAPALLTTLVLVAGFLSHAADENVITVAPGESIQAAIDKAPAGSVVRLQSGEYIERVVITKALTLEGGGADNTRITIEEPDAKETGAAQAELQKRFESATTAEEKRTAGNEWVTRVVRPAVTVRDTENVTIRNLRLQGLSPYGPDNGGTLSVLLHFTRAKGSVNDCAVVGPFGNGIHLTEASDVSITRSLIAAFWREGIIAFGRGRSGSESAASRLHLSDSEVRNVYHYGVQLGNGCDSSIIERCRISGTAWHGIRYDHASPTITGNTIYMHARSGIYASGTTRATVRGNLFWKNEMSGMSCWMANEDVIEGNTFVENQREGLAVLGGSKPQVTRNIFVRNPVAILAGRIASRSGQASAIGEPVLTANLYHENPVVLQAGEEKKPAPEGSTVADPLFVAPANQDFTLAAGSPARTANIGVPEPLRPNPEIKLLPEEKAIVPAAESRDYRQWTAPGAPKPTQNVQELSIKAHRESEAWIADAFQLDDHNC